jgi:hypothetical protein
MKKTRRLFVLLAMLAAVLVLAACNADAQEATPAAAEEVEQDTEAAAEENVEQAEPAAAEALALTETYAFPGFGFSIDYPGAWLTETRDTVTSINQVQSDLDRAFVDSGPPQEGVGVSFDHRDRAFMRNIGLSEDASLDDLRELNQGFFEWQEPLETQEVELFGAPALRVKASEGDGWSYAYMGFANDRVFLLVFAAPTEQELDDHLATWDEMLASIQPVEE